MNRLFGILIGVVLLFSLPMGAAAHASETICLPDVEASAAYLHADGDMNQSKDSENGVPHHHGGCHGHHVAAPVDAGETVGLIGSSDRLSGIASALAALAAPGAALRPPIA
ncbi:hypothetical protein ACPVPU_12265 [Sphingomonas sp. CJ99]